MKKLTATESSTIAEQVGALPDRSILVLARVDRDFHDFVSTDIYQNFFGQWSLMDPGDRYDGEMSWTSENVSVIAQRDGAEIYVAFDPRELVSSSQ